MRYREILVERVLNLKSPQERMPYAQQVWDMLQRSYKKIGGFKSVSNIDELINEPGYWKVIRRGDAITAVTIYKISAKTKNFKVIASATETDYDDNLDRYKATLRGLNDYNMMKNDDIKMKRSWAEVSGPAEIVMKRAGAVPVSNKFAHFLTGKHIFDHASDGYHYTRLIHGEPHEKIIYGFLDLTVEAMTELFDMGIDLKKLPDNMAAKLDR